MDAAAAAAPQLDKAFIAYRLITPALQDRAQRKAKKCILHTRSASTQRRAQHGQPAAAVALTAAVHCTYNGCMQ